MYDGCLGRAMGDVDKSRLVDYYRSFVGRVTLGKEGRCLNRIDSKV